MTYPDNYPPSQIVNISEAVRRAVYLEDCERLGHDISYKNLLVMGDTPNPESQDGLPNLEIMSSNEGELPHIFCKRCNSTWVLIDEPGFGYDDTVRKVQKRMGTSLKPEALKPHPMQERIRTNRERLIEERKNLGKNVPREVVKDVGGGNLERRTISNIPSYLQPRSKNGPTQ